MRSDPTDEEYPQQGAGTRTSAGRRFAGTFAYRTYTARNKNSHGDTTRNF
jgi:hypothetical protein